MTKDEALRLADQIHAGNGQWMQEAANELRRLHRENKWLKAALEAKDETHAYGYAKRLAEAIWSKHYKTTAPQWEPFDELIGVLTQIDNMTAGLISPPQRKPLTDEEIWACLPKEPDEMVFARAIEAKLKEKNT